jgi:hypothetical protein
LTDWNCTRQLKSIYEVVKMSKINDNRFKPLEKSIDQLEILLICNTYF